MNLLINADARNIPLADQSVHCIVTSPPYFGLRDYQVPGQIGLEPTPDDFVQAMVAVGRQLWRVLRDDGTWWLNLGDSYAGSGGAGGDYAEGGLREDQPKYKSNFTIVKSKRNAKRWGGGNVPATGNIKPKDLIGIPWMVAFALRNEGWYLRQDIIWHKPNPMPESVKDRCTKAHEYIFLLTKSAKYYYDNEAVKVPSKDPNDDRGSRGNRKRKPTELISGIRDSGIYPMANRRSVWTVTTKPYPGSHYATFPPDLIEPCILAGTSEKGVCPKCGAPWERVVERGKLISTDGTSDNYKPKKYIDDPKVKGRSDGWVTNHYVEQTTTGWRPTCEHYPRVDEWLEIPHKKKGELDNEYLIHIAPIIKIQHELVVFWNNPKFITVPATVLDPFAGSGTTLMVARKHGRNGIGLDLSFDYLNTNARERLVYGGFVPVADGVNQLTINM